jgi:starch phosphorylase
MYKVREYSVRASLPEKLEPLRSLAANLWWTWNPEAQDLFRRLDPSLWQRLERNPVELLSTIDQRRLQQAAADPAFVAHLTAVMNALHMDMTTPAWFEREFGDQAGGPVAYFSAEFGLHESLPLYSGGLGVLAGDHLKSASDLGVPVVGVSLLYQFGYFHQHLSNDGMQFEEYPPLALQNMAIERITDPENRPVKVTIPLSGRQVTAQLWRVQVGRIPLYLLDTYVPENAPEDREITGRLYGGDQHMRIRQEIVLGVGGVRALRAVGSPGAVYHMNEGHCAFLAVERVRELVQGASLSFDEACEVVAGSTLFTTHTPVPAGIDTFPPGLVEPYLRPLAEAMGMNSAALLALGQLAPSRESEPFSMAILALKLSSHCNGVSRLHASVARKMWHPLWKQLPAGEVPITSVTNGIHLRTWQSGEMARLFDRYLGPDWARNPTDSPGWDHIEGIPDAELWRAHERLRERLVVEVRARLKQQLQRRGASATEVDTADEVLDPEGLTIGFARRFATYKRATLFLKDPPRLEALLGDADRPVQFIFSGKAHPRDMVGKEFIQRIVAFARRSAIRTRVVFLEDYSIGISRALVQGCDVWLNNPVRLLEASGTSGMKVTPNGGINCSILDGWWPEAYDGTNGWAIGDERLHESEEYQEQVEAATLYDLLEREIVPMFYDRGTDGLPRRWIAKMKASMRTCCSQFSANRMVREYAAQLYVPALRRAAELGRDNFATARELARWKRELAQRWSQVRVEEISDTEADSLAVGAHLNVSARVHLGEITPADVSVEVYHGPVNGVAEITEGRVTPLAPQGDPAGGVYTYRGAVPCERTGRHAYAVRIVPHHPAVEGKYATGLITWG